MKFWRKVFAVVRKDVISELRSREVIIAVLVFALLAVLIFNFAFDTNQSGAVAAVPGIMWVTFAFAGTLSLNRAFITERESGCMEALLMSPIDRESIFVAKAIDSLIFMLPVEILVLWIIQVLFNVPAITWQIIVITLLTTIGFSAVGTLFAAMAVNTRARELVLPILFLPVISPLIISAVKATTVALNGGAWGDMIQWLEIIGGFDIIFVTASYLVFDFVVEE
ncbi:MAG TPA: heme exporter protein CcmB [Dehalococcoidales bacterium]|nr:heme exporter protein CcmB [Dehalococcoidales bacterium]